MCHASFRRGAHAKNPNPKDLGRLLSRCSTVSKTVSQTNTHAVFAARFYATEQAATQRWPSPNTQAHGRNVKKSVLVPKKRSTKLVAIHNK